MNCVVIFVDVKPKKNRFPRINPHHLAALNNLAASEGEQERGREGDRERGGEAERERESTTAPVAASQIFTVSSSDALTTRFPSGEKETERTAPECPLRKHTCHPPGSDSTASFSDLLEKAGGLYQKPAKPPLEGIREKARGPYQNPAKPPLNGISPRLVAWVTKCL